MRYLIFRYSCVHIILNSKGIIDKTLIPESKNFITLLATIVLINIVQMNAKAEAPSTIQLCIIPKYTINAISAI